MSELHPGPEALRALTEKVPATGALAMLNLLRFRDEADYPSGSGHPPCSGREAYARYVGLILPRLRRVGARPVYRGCVALAFIAPEAERWDEMLIVRYPGRAAFERFIADPGFVAAAVHRTAALADSRLLVLTGAHPVGRLGGWLLGLATRLRGR